MRALLYGITHIFHPIFIVIAGIFSVDETNSQPSNFWIVLIESKNCLIVVGVVLTLDIWRLVVIDIIGIVDVATSAGWMARDVSSVGPMPMRIDGMTKTLFFPLAIIRNQL